MTPFSRREFLKKVYRVVIAAGAAPLLSFEELLAAEADERSRPRPNLVWLQGSSCSGCSISLLNIEQITVLDLLTQFSRLLYHPNLAQATGNQVGELLSTLADGDEPYLLVLEGGIPATMPHACMLDHQPLGHWVSRLAAGASACLAAGTCAVSGGVAAMPGTLTGVVSLTEHLAQEGIKTPVVNLPGCPMKPEHLVYTLLYFMRHRSLPELDGRRRPNRFFSHTIHQRCPRYASFQEQDFARHIWEEGCLLELGCQGPVTYNDCPGNGYNGNSNYCLRAGHPCIGCASELFPRPVLYHLYDDPRVRKGLLQGDSIAPYRRERGGTE
ncbi:oxidoreductase [Desulfurivibrio alkaliphilus]|uniref:Hydrogenase (NiFe) small subunit HydA n=1 Tax=Desulfurivibrio alkaliphilus (strain DSM 19089 / UNIQEM U267 / AHT2) TaxID=589865 RepID=D6Z1C3_DESAT|nr:oxidoreductase [Desulfurivibrio alkaliphilus]ADH85378.1 hydrogenase (NiFe) small subunit HydA [Desulfurivibrio alkaliphilus AHT 2]